MEGRARAVPVSAVKAAAAKQRRRVLRGYGVTKAEHGSARLTILGTGGVWARNHAIAGQEPRGIAWHPENHAVQGQEPRRWNPKTREPRPLQNL